MTILGWETSSHGMMSCLHAARGHATYHLTVLALIRMNYSNEKIIEQIESGDNLKYLFFWGHTSSNEISKSCLSQWYDSKFVVNDVEYLTAEHWMMAEKALLFEDYEIQR